MSKIKHNNLDMFLEAMDVDNLDNGLKNPKAIESKIISLIDLGHSMEEIIDILAPRVGDEVLGDILVKMKKRGKIDPQMFEDGCAYSCDNQAVDDVDVGVDVDSAPCMQNKSIDQDDSAMTLAQQFHDTYEQLAPSFGYETRADTKEFDPESPNGQLMVAVCQEILSQNSNLEATPISEPSTEIEISQTIPPEELTESTFSAKYYKMIAGILNKHHDKYSDVIESIAQDFAQIFQRDNPNFQPERFMQDIQK
jgi:hypothetical protein